MDRSFYDLFGREPDTTAQAPGRVNLIGEHTDYNGGYVLPMAIPQQTRVQLALRPDHTVRAWSANVESATALSEYRLGSETQARRWVDYIQGITAIARQEGLDLRGFDLWTESDVPQGAGLSSSAALQISLLRALRRVFSWNVDDVGLARLGQRAENEFVGAPVGIMDQMASMLADTETALFLDTRTLQYENVSLPPEAEIIVVHSAVVHDHASSAYRLRRTECERAAALLGVRQIRDLEGEGRQLVLTRLSELPEPLNRRARHVVMENERVLSAVQALRAGDLPSVGSLFEASHESMRNDFEVSTPDIDLLVNLAKAEADIYGARLTGGGFGGSVVMLAGAGFGAATATRIADRYAQQSGRTPVVLVPDRRVPQQVS